MKYLITISIFCFVFLTTATAQMDRSIAPKSTIYPATLFGKVTEIELPAFTKEDLQQFDWNDSKNGNAPACAHNIATNINLDNAGTWTPLPNGDRVWRVQITAAGALALSPIFNQLYLPPGATLHFYMPGGEETLGAFTNYNTPAPRGFCPGLIHGQSCVVEYYEPLLQRGKGILIINRVGYGYRDIAPLTTDLKSGSASCEVNVACPEGDNWRNQIRSVVRVYIVGENDEDAWCSGSLVNTVRNDCTPYVLSAEHCIEQGVSAEDYADWVFYFNYQTDSCTGVYGPPNEIVSGCTLIANSNDSASRLGSDFLLVQLLSPPPSAYNVYYSGWNATDAVPDTGVCIHHPEADLKKISTYTSPAISTNGINSLAQNTHWEVTWVATEDGHGVTEPGSSGSPLYDQNNLIVGHLTGGSSCCVQDGCTNDPGGGPSSPDIFGKIWYDWASDGVSAAVQLKPWLDPDNTGNLTWQGQNPPCGSSLDNDAGIQAIPEPSGNVCTPTITPVVALRNFGANVLTSATIYYKYDNNSLTPFYWTGSLDAGSTVNVTFPSTTLSAGTHTFTAEVSSPNGETNTNTANTTITSTFFVSSTGGSIVLTLTTDSAGRKTTWQITDNTNNTVAEGGPYPDLEGGTTYNIPMCLPAGCYTFTIFSAQNNGMTEQVNGNFVLSNVGGTEVYAQLSNPSFGANAAYNFCLTAVNVLNIVPEPVFSVVPNPSTGQFNVSFSTMDEKTVQVYDITGRLILAQKTSEQTFILDLTNESRGVYLLQVANTDGKTVQKLVLK